MGNYLTVPNSEKQSDDGQIGKYVYGISAMQGWRMSMEDAHIIHFFDSTKDFTTSASSLSSHTPPQRQQQQPPPAYEGASLFGVYDGHGGPQVAKFVANNLVEQLCRQPDFHRGQFDIALRNAYIKLDSLLRTEEAQEELEWYFRNDDGEGSNPYLPQQQQQSRAETTTTPATSSPAAALGQPPPATEGGSNKSRKLKAAVKLSGKKLYRKVHDKRKKSSASFDSSSAVSSSNDAGESTRHDSIISANSSEGSPHMAAGPSPPSLLPFDHHQPPGGGNGGGNGGGGGERQLDGTTLPQKFKSHPNIITASDPDAAKSKLRPRAHSDDPIYSRRESTSGGDVSTGDGPGVMQAVKNFFMNIMRTGGVPRVNNNTPANGLAMMAGCTAVTVLITDSQIVVANSGDSRAVLCRGTVAVELSTDHKPTLPEERNRILGAGGWLEMGRVNGNLNLSRALGDLVYKANTALPPEKQIVSAVPDVVFIDIQDDDDFLVVGCDGIWESSTSQEIVDFIKSRINRVQNLSSIVESLFGELLSPNPAVFEFGCDNMTAILVDLKRGQRLYEEVGNEVSLGVPGDLMENGFSEVLAEDEEKDLWSENISAEPAKQDGVINSSDKTLGAGDSNDKLPNPAT